ncbi:Erlin-2 [Sesbania bispinosa]|nr:Erlin-2 [Sesbania bispinosa]
MKKQHNREEKSNPRPCITQSHLCLLILLSPSGYLRRASVIRAAACLLVASASVAFHLRRRLYLHRAEQQSANCPSPFKVHLCVLRKVAEKEAETVKKMAISEAEKNANVSKILMEHKLLEKDSARRQEEIENEMYLVREKSLADADFYRVIREAEANRLKLTAEFLQLKFIEAIANNTKIFFGDKLVPMRGLDIALWVLDPHLENIVASMIPRD